MCKYPQHTLNRQPSMHTRIACIRVKDAYEKDSLGPHKLQLVTPVMVLILGVWSEQGSRAKRKRGAMRLQTSHPHPRTHIQTHKTALVR